MRTKDGNIHLEIQTSRKSPVGVIRSSYYSERTTKHKQFGRIVGCNLETLKLLQKAFHDKGVVPVDVPEAFNIVESKEYGASRCILQVIKKIGLDKVIYSKKEPWVNSILAMIAGRIIYAGSKLSLCKQGENTTLWEQCEIKEPIDVEKHCYLPMDKLLSRQKAIQKKLSKKHLKEGHLVLYDITSSYFEGDYEHSDLISFGYNRDKKNGHKQIVIGLLCNKDGCPVSSEVFAGNTKDETTVLDKTKELKKQYNLKNIIFVGDRGMLTNKNMNELQDLDTVTALTRPSMRALIENKVIFTQMFKHNEITEIYDPDDLTKRYCLCKNPISAERDKITRERLIKIIKSNMEKIAKYKKRTTVELIGSRIGKLLSKYNMSKFIQWEVIPAKERLSLNHKLIWNIDKDNIKKSQQLDGCYVITTKVNGKRLNKYQVVESYKRLSLVEQAFRNLKTVSIELRPMYHHKDERIKAHVFLCKLAYYVQWHMQQALNKYFDKNEQFKKKNIEEVVQTLRQITHNKTKVDNVHFYSISNLTKNQEKIVKALDITI
jgi:transposase